MKQLSFAVAIAILFLTSCVSFETTAYRSIGAVAVAVDGGMNGWGDYVRAGKATPANEQAVKLVYEKYQASMRVAQSAVNSYKSGASDKTALNKALDALDASKNELITLIQVLRK